MNDQIYHIPTEIIVPRGFITLISHDKNGKIIDVQHYKNLITDVGKQSLAEAFIGTTSNSQGIGTYHAVGTNSTAPAAGNIQLGTEIFRKLVSVRSRSGKYAQFQTFFTTSEGNGTLREVGLFGDSASGTANSGTLFAHAAISRTKSSSDTLTILHEILMGG